MKDVDVLGMSMFGGIIEAAAGFLDDVEPS
jgi:hypothetical protein